MGDGTFGISIVFSRMRWSRDGSIYLPMTAPPCDRMHATNDTMTPSQILDAPASRSHIQSLPSSPTLLIACVLVPWKYKSVHSKSDALCIPCVRIRLRYRSVSRSNKDHRDGGTTHSSCGKDRLKVTECVEPTIQHHALEVGRADEGTKFVTVTRWWWWCVGRNVRTWCVVKNGFYNGVPF